MLQNYYEKATTLLLFAKTLTERWLNINKIEANKATPSMRPSAELTEDADSFSSALRCSAPWLTLAIPTRAMHKAKKRASVFWINPSLRQPFLPAFRLPLFLAIFASTTPPFVYLFPLDAEADGKCNEKKKKMRRGENSWALVFTVFYFCHLAQDAGF